MAKEQLSVMFVFAGPAFEGRAGEAHGGHRVAESPIFWIFDSDVQATDFHLRE